MRTILNLTLVPHLRERTPSRSPLVSVIVPARDEERMIGQAARALLAQTYPALEIIIVNDRSSDATGKILAAFDDPRLIAIAGEEPPPGWLGKPWALHQGALRARGELLLFVDADVLYEPGTVTAAVAELERHSDASLLALLPRIHMQGFWEHVVMANMAVFAFTMMPLWLANRTRFAFFAIGGGPGNLVRRDDYIAAGGHEALRDAVVDDVGLARLMRRSGRRTLAISAPELVSVRMYHGLHEIVEGFTKNMFAVLNRNYALALAVFVGAIGFNLLPFVLALMGDRVSWLTVAMILITRLILFLRLGYRVDNALLGHPLMVGVWCYILLRSLWLTGIRRRLDWRGRTYDASRTRFGAD